MEAGAFGILAREMKCEKCHKAEAETVIHANENGRDREYYVCKACAAESERRRKAAARKGRGKPRAGLSLTINALPENMVPPPVLDALMSATADLMGSLAGRADAAARKEDIKCKVCGHTWEDYSESGLLGCPACYHAFRERLEDRLRKVHVATSCGGKVPMRRSGEAVRKSIEKRMAEAVAAQDFEEARRLRDQLSGLDGGDGVKEGE